MTKGSTMKRFAVLAAAALLASTAPAANAPRSLPVGACINMGDQLEAQSETGHGGARIEAADFKRIRDAGFRTVRIPVHWSDKTGDGPGYPIDPKWIARVTTVVDQALAAHLNVILNDHHFEALDNDPAANSAKLVAIWTQVATHFANRPTRTLWFEIENEPHAKLTSANLMATLRPALAAIRASNPKRPVVIGGENWSGIDSLSTLDLPADPNVYPTFHYYEPFDFTHQGAGWVRPSPPKVGRTYGTAADAQRLVDDAAKIKTYVARTGLVPFMGETGAYDRYIPIEQRVQYTQAVHKAFTPLGVDQCAWAYTNTFPFYDHAAGRWLPGLRGAFGLPEK
jgi:endoglucanase